MIKLLQKPHQIYRAKDESGFTIIELLIATTIFAVILILMTVTFVAVTRVYYKGISATNTQNTTRGIMNDVAKSIEFSGGGPTTVVYGSGSGFDWYCINDSQNYIFTPSRTSLSPSSAGMVYANYNSCATPSDITTVTNAGKELLNSTMRVTYFSVSLDPGGNNLYDISLQIVSGPNNILCSRSVANSCSSNTVLPVLDYYGDNLAQCKYQAGNQFCALSRLDSEVTVQGGLD